MRGHFGKMTQLADGPAYLYTCACAYANVNIQSEYKQPSPDAIIEFLECFSLTSIKRVCC